MAASNHISNVAIVGAGGNSGRVMTEALLKTGKHIVTAITRVDSQTKLPEGVLVKRVDYDKTNTLVDALSGQNVMVITLAGNAPPDTEMKLINAAGEVGVPWILPSEWAPDTANEALVNGVFIFQSKVSIRKAISDLGKSSYIAVSTGFWYEYMLAIPATFGIDFAKRTVVLFDEGQTKVSVSTLPQVGRVVAALLSLPISSHGSACLQHYKDQVVYVNSFTVSQIDMLESACRVTGTKLDDWTITKEPSHERYASGVEQIKDGKRIGFAKMMATRVFYPDGCGDTEHNKGTLNGVLGLPKEDLDEATQAAVERARTVPNWAEEGS